METVELLGHIYNIKIIKKPSLKRVHFKFENQALIITSPLNYKNENIIQLLKENERRIVRFIANKNVLEVDNMSQICILDRTYKIIHSDTNFIQNDLISLKKPYLSSMNETIIKLSREYLENRTRFWCNYIYKDIELPTICIKIVKSYRGQYNKKMHKITYNVLLLLCSKTNIDYVIVHELAHIKYMNHSSKFYCFIEQYLPNYKLLRRNLKKEWINLC